MPIPLLLSALLLMAIPAPARAQSPDPLRPTMSAHPVGEPLRIDGRLEEAVWSSAPSFQGFVQKEPVEAAPAQNDSEVWVLYDDDAVYVGARLYDESPGTIARNMVRRDSNYNGQFDYFEVMFDPNLDRRTGYRFRVSAAGVQTDRYLFDDGGEDAAWDAVWSSAVRITDDGWHVEMRIPLSQMRYEQGSDSQTWGLNFGRRRAADNELTRFALESKLQPGRVSQFGLLEGVRIEGTPQRIEMRPYALTRVRRQPLQTGNPFLEASEVGGQVGVDLRYGLGTQFTLDATLNPDFGQVEVDPAVINLTAFETFFEERRPFFVEDARVFDFNLSGGGNRVFYSRRVGRAPQGPAPPGAAFADVPDNTTIIGAAKLTGRTRGGLSVGALAAVTGSETGSFLPGNGGPIQDFTAQPRVGHGVVRISQDLNDGLSNIGGLATYLRRDLPEDGTLDALPVEAFGGGVDFEHNWAERTYAVWGFLAGSHVRGDSAALLRIQRSSNHYLQRPDLAWSALDPSRTALSGAEWRLQAEKRRGRWTAALWAAQVTSGFEINDLGFSRSRERLDGGARLGLQQVSLGEHLRAWDINAITFHNWSHEALRDAGSWDAWQEAHTAGTFSLRSNVTFLNFWKLSLGGSYGPENMSRTATRGGPRMREPGRFDFSGSIATDNRRMISLTPRVAFARGREGAGGLFEVSAAVKIQPSTRVEIELAPNYRETEVAAQYVATSSALPFAGTFGNRYLFADLERRSVSMVTRLNWTFTPRLTLQFFAQPLLSAGDYVSYKQLAKTASFEFDVFEEGSVTGAAASPSCSGGRTCEDQDHRRYFDFDGDGSIDFALSDRDFNIRSLRANAVLRWEYRPGSTMFFVWQRNQLGRSSFGDFDFNRDVSALRRSPVTDTFIIKVNLWLSL